MDFGHWKLIGGFESDVFFCFFIIFASPVLKLFLERLNPTGQKIYRLVVNSWKFEIQDCILMRDDLFTYLEVLVGLGLGVGFTVLSTATVDV